MKKLYLIGYYRQWKILNGIDNNNRTKQNKRFEEQTNRWEKMMNDNPNTEVIICRDFNVNAKIWKKLEEENSEYEKSFNKMSKMIKEKMIDNGLKLINNIYRYVFGITMFSRSLTHDGKRILCSETVYFEFKLWVSSCSLYVV